MTDVAVPEAPAAPSTPKKSPKAKAAAKKPKHKPEHPKTSEMVNSAIEDLRERGGSSLQAIKKYITNNYKADADKLAPYIKKYLKSAVESGSLVRTKGRGALGSFKLEAATKPPSTTKRTLALSNKKAAAEKKAVKAGRVQKKKVVAKKAPAAAAPKKVAKAKTPTKAKKTKKPPTKKPKAPVAKKAAKKGSAKN